MGLVAVPGAHGQAQAAGLTLTTTPGPFVAGDEIGVQAEVEDVDRPAGSGDDDARGGSGNDALVGNGGGGRDLSSGVERRIG